MITLKPIAAKPSDIIKMRSTIKSFYRDWSTEGTEERKQCYQPIIDEVESFFPNPVN